MKSQHQRSGWIMQRKKLGNASIGGGTDGYFTELNRNRPPIENIDFCRLFL